MTWPWGFWCIAPVSLKIHMLKKRNYEYISPPHWKVQIWKYCNILACLLFQCFETGGNATEEDWKDDQVLHKITFFFVLFLLISAYEFIVDKTGSYFLLQTLWASHNKAFFFFTFWYSIQTFHLRYHQFKNILYILEK